MTEASSDLPTFRALLVGCDLYFPNRLPSGASYLPLGGCVRDIDRIERVLRGRIQGPLAITRLAASQGAGQPSEPPAEWPTAANLRAALESLIAQSQRGDQVFIYYSGHGGRALTAHADLKGAGAMDEALVPIDIGGGPGIVASNYLRDVELAGYVTRIAARVGAGGPGGGALGLCFDSCHAGGTLRGAGRVAQRCATGGTGVDATLDTTPLDVGEQAASAEAGHAWAELQRNALRSAGAATRWLPPSRSYVLLAACSDTESAIEADGADGELGGVLTGALLEALGSLAGRPSWVTVYHRVLARVQARFASQTPQLLGDPLREVFGAELTRVEPSVPVLEVDAAARRVRVGAGRATLVEPGTEFGIFRPGTADFSVNDALVASATVTRAQAAECWADLAPASDPGRIELGAPAVVLQVVLRRTAAMFRRTDLPEAIAARQEAALSAVEAALARSGRGFVVEAAGASPDYQVVVNQRGEYEIWDPRGDVIPYLTPPLRADPAIAAQVVERLRRLCRYQTVLDLTSPASELDRAVEIELLADPPTWREGDPIPPASQLTPLVRDADVYPVRNQQAVFLRVTNQAARAINVAAVDLNCSWGIDLLVPDPATGASSEVVGDGESRLFPIVMYLPPGFTTTRDIIKVFAAVGNAPFAWLTQPAINQPLAARGTRRGAGTGALAQLFDALDAEANATRAARPAMSPDLAWTVSAFRLQVT